MHELGTIEPPRKLTGDELAVMERLLAEDFPGARELRLQLPHARVRGECGCGCPSITFTVDTSAAPPSEVDDLFRIDGIARAGRKTAITVMLFFLNGYFDELEVLGSRGKVPKRLPAVDELKVYV